MLAKIIGIIGSIALAASTLLPWGKLVFIKFGGETTKQVGGIQLLPGQIALGLGVVALILMIVRPKFAILPGILGIGMGLWYYFADVMGTPFKVGIGLFIAFAAGLLIVLGGYMAPAKKAA